MRRFAQGSTIKFSVSIDMPVGADFIVSIYQDCEDKAYRVAKSEMQLQGDDYIGTLSSALTSRMSVGRYFVEVLVKEADGDNYIGLAKCSEPAFELVCSASKSLV